MSRSGGGSIRRREAVRGERRQPPVRWRVVDPVRRRRRDGHPDTGDGLVCHAVGPVQEWPQSLCTAVGIMLESRFPDCLAEQLLGDGHDDDVAYQHTLGVGASVTTTVAAHVEQLAALRRTLRQWLTASGVDQDTAQDLVLAVGAATSNAVEHAYLDGNPGSVELTVSRYAEELRLEGRDHGRWRTSPAPGLCVRGLKMIEKLTDSLTVHLDDHGTTIRIRKGLPQ